MPDHDFQRKTPTGFIIVLVGIVLVTLSVLVFDWVASTGPTGRLGPIELIDEFRGKDVFQTAPQNRAMTRIVTILLLAPVAAIMAVAATWPAGHGPRILARFLAAGLVVWQLAVHASAVANIQEATSGEQLDIGILVSVIGYLLLLVGAVIGPRLPRRSASRPAWRRAPAQPVPPPARPAPAPPG